MKTIWTDIKTLFEKLKFIGEAVFNWTKNEIIKLEQAGQNFVKNLLPSIKALINDIVTLLATIKADSPLIYQEGAILLKEIMAFEQALETVIIAL